MQRRRRFTRFVGGLAAFALALQVGVPVAAAAQLAACCCQHKDAHCQCSICEHQREKAANIPCMKTCGSAPETASPVPLVTFEPPLAAPVAPLPLPEPVAIPVPGRPESPVLEVPTPPPLA
jgi:hypothetical protein